MSLSLVLSTTEDGLSRSSHSSGNGTTAFVRPGGSTPPESPGIFVLTVPVELSLEEARGTWAVGALGDSRLTKSRPQVLLCASSQTSSLVECWSLRKEGLPVNNIFQQISPVGELPQLLHLGKCRPRLSSGSHRQDHSCWDLRFVLRQGLNSVSLTGLECTELHLLNPGTSSVACVPSTAPGGCWLPAWNGTLKLQSLVGMAWDLRGKEMSCADKG